MKKLFVLIVALTFVLVLEPAANASSRRQDKGYARHALAYVHRKPTRGTDDWYPRDASKLPIGTRKWFDQMLRENKRNPG
jgi:hypothetical protein